MQVFAEWSKLASCAFTVDFCTGAYFLMFFEVLALDLLFAVARAPHSNAPAFVFHVADDNIVSCHETAELASALPLGASCGVTVDVAPLKLHVAIAARCLHEFAVVAQVMIKFAKQADPFANFVDVLAAGVSAANANVLECRFESHVGHDSKISGSALRAAIFI